MWRQLHITSVVTGQREGGEGGGEREREREREREKGKGRDFIVHVHGGNLFRFWSIYTHDVRIGDV
jgi:hypothetical protein